VGIIREADSLRLLQVCYVVLGRCSGRKRDEGDVRRREFITVLGGSAVGWALGARAQQLDRRRVGVLMSLTKDDPEDQRRLASLQEGLLQLGWARGKIQFDIRWYVGEARLARSAATELIGSQPDLIVAHGTPGLQAVSQQTRAIPIVFVGVSDPVGQGLVETLARPGGNVTGFSLFDFSFGSKWLEALKLVAPEITRVGVLFNPETRSFIPYMQSIEAMASSFRVEPIKLEVRNTGEIEAAVSDLGRRSASGLLLIPDPFTNAHRELIVRLVASHRLAAVYWHRAFPTEGGLMSYGVDVADLYRRAATYVDKILTGAKPADLPVQQPTKFELVINLKTAKALGLSVPPTLLARADEVIE
jgi:ABC-type uncharacterized transport system substrate-binding protein